jgi:hypothetical protein
MTNRKAQSERLGNLLVNRSVPLSITLWELPFRQPFFRSSEKRSGGQFRGSVDLFIARRWKTLFDDGRIVLSAPYVDSVLKWYFMTKS